MTNNLPLQIATCQTCTWKANSFNSNNIEDKAENHMMQTGHIVEITEEY